MTHLAISGELGSGKSVVAHRLSEILGHRVVSTGDIQREIASSLHLSTLQTNVLAESDQAIDQRVDGVTRELGVTEDDIIFDSRMAWHMVPTAFKVHILVDRDVAARRMFARVAAAEDYASPAEAARGANERYLSERKRFLGTYGVDVARLRNYDLVLDSTVATVEQVCAAIVTAFRRRAAEWRFEMWVAPSRVAVSAPIAQQWAARGGGGDAGGRHRGDGVGVAGGDGTGVGRAGDGTTGCAAPSVVYSRPTVLALDGLERISSAASRGDPLLRVHLIAEADEIAWDGPTAERLVETAQLR